MESLSLLPGYNSAMTSTLIITAPNFEGIPGLVHGFGLRNSVWPDPVILVKQIQSEIFRDAARS